MASFPHYVKLNNEAHMPIIGLGTWQVKAGELEAAVETAIEYGYRHIDTAWFYTNEKDIGNVLKRVFDAGKLKREDIFVVSKLPNEGHHRDKVLHYLQESLDDLQLSYVDLYLVHFPISVVPTDGDAFYPKKDGKPVIDYEADLVDTWKGMEDAVDAGMTKAIGLSNFNSEQIKRIYENARIKPANLQVECHAYLPQVKLFELCKELNITFTAYGPLGNPSLSIVLKENFGILTALPATDAKKEQDRTEADKEQGCIEAERERKR
ncbi:aldo-keto reductase family 1 member B1-like isoform X4 [Tachypleus tridentatus]|uniref:aldo-keto reductase family 1 member B1-like isoform X4 n=1 Tax=Tachypleus tridentatus TaxID=6853 RepID=UPI003FD3AEC6